MQSVNEKAQESAEIAAHIAIFLNAGGKIQVIPTRYGADLHAAVRRATKPTYSNNEQQRKFNSMEN